MTVGERLEEFLKSQFSKKKDMAEALDLTYNNLYQYFTGRRNPGADILTRVAKLGCDVNWLLTGEKRNRAVYIKEPDGIYKTPDWKLEEMNYRISILEDEKHIVKLENEKLRYKVQMLEKQLNFEKTKTKIDKE